MPHLFDMGITDYAMKESAKGNLPDLFPEDPPDMHECLSETLVVEEPGFQAACVTNFTSIFQISLFYFLCHSYVCCLKF